MVDPDRSWIWGSAGVFARLRRDLSFAIAWSISVSRGIARPGLLVALLIVLVPLCLMLLQPASKAVGPSTITVNNTTDPASTSGNGFCTLREAINNANSPGVDTTGGDCAAGTGQDTINFSVSGTITLSSTRPIIANGSSGSLTIDGSGQAITIDGAHLFGVLLVVFRATLNLNNLTIANGNNSTGGGGGVTNSGGTLTITNSTFSGNTAGLGGGVASSGTLTVSNSTFSGNSGGLGGGVAIDGAALTITNSTFSGNSAGVGGGIDIGTDTGGTQTITNSTFSGNSASEGGGIANGGALTVINSTFSGNSAADGDAIYRDHDINNNPAGTATVTNSILTMSTSGGNCGGAGTPPVTDGGYNISDDTTCGFTGTGANGKTIGDSVPPQLDPKGLKSNGGPTQTIALQSTSPAVDAIPIAQCLPTDQRGTARPDSEDSTKPSPACDIGAFEADVGAPGPRPLVIIPGIMGSELDRVDNNNPVWVSVEAMGFELGLGDSCSDFLFQLLLNSDGASPDSSSRCSLSGSPCTTDSDCGMLPLCAGIHAQNQCLPLGANVIANREINLPPVYTSYDTLIASLGPDGGYFRGTNLFVFPFDWRLDLAGQVDALHAKVQSLSGSFEGVDIIAHSQGGLLTRAYLATYPGDAVNNVIFLGTPHLGVTEAYSVLAGHTNLEAKFLDFEVLGLTVLNYKTISSVAQNFPGLYELLPQYNFIRCGSTLEPFELSDSSAYAPPRTPCPSAPAGTPGPNPALVSEATAFETLMAKATAPPRAFAINGTAHWTPKELDLSNPNCPRIGHPDPTGDGTVSTESSTQFVPTTRTYYVDEKHLLLPSNTLVEEQILNILRGNENDVVAGITRTTSNASVDTWIDTTCSPIRLRISDPSGNLVGIDSTGNLLEEIPGSSHFKFPENESGLLPINTNYSITLDATDIGLFTLQFDRLRSTDASVSGSIVYSNIPISIHSHGSLTLTPTSTNPDLSLDVNGDGTVDFVVPANRPPNPAMFPAALLDAVKSLSLPAGIATSLISKLNAAVTALKQGNNKAARSDLEAFINEVAAQQGKMLTVDQADQLTKVANAGLALL